jgi:superfamily II DNA helicase RecQ
MVITFFTPISLNSFYHSIFAVIFTATFRTFHIFFFGAKAINYIELTIPYIKYWGYSFFRELQEEIIFSVAEEKKDTLALMPTGGGKSITFQVPALAMEGLCLVVTPLIALMKDQVENLRKRNIKALMIHSGMTAREIDITLNNAVFGDYKFLYLSPERLQTDIFRTRLFQDGS